MTPVETILLTAGISSGATLVGRLIWDKMSGGGVGRKCADHEGCIIKLAEIKRTQETHKEKFEKGEKRMDAMADDIGEIKTGVALLVQRADLHEAAEKKEKG